MMATFDAHRLWRLGGVAALVAAMVNVAILFGGRALGISFDIPTAPSPIGPVQVVVSTLGPFVVGLGATAAAAGQNPARLRTMQIVAVVVTALSLASPLLLAGDAASRVALSAMHVVACVAFVATLRRVDAERAAGSVPARQRTA
jgi:hypothetical protein